MKKLGKITLIACSLAFFNLACESKKAENNTEDVIDQENPAASDAEDANNASVEGDTKETGDNIEDQAEQAGTQADTAQ